MLAVALFDEPEGVGMSNACPINVGSLSAQFAWDRVARAVHKLFS